MVSERVLVGTEGYKARLSTAEMMEVGSIMYMQLDKETKNELD